MRVISVLRTTSGLDEFPIFRALLKIDPNLINFDDRMYGFHELPNQISRIERRLNRVAYSEKFNNDIQRYLRAYQPKLMVIFKAPHIYFNTIDVAKSCGTRVLIIYPDLDPRVHGPSYLGALRNADAFYFTKPNLALQFKSQISKDSRLIFPLYSRDDLSDPDSLNPDLGLVFVGHFSPGKSIDLERMARIYKDRITIFGDGWGAAGWVSHMTNVKVFSALYGDAIRDVYRQALCNLGLLMESLGKGWPGDEITARSVHVPVSGGLLLHPRNSSSELLFGGQSPILYSDLSEAAAILEKIKQRPTLRISWALMQQNAIKENGTCIEDLVNEWVRST